MKKQIDEILLRFNAEIDKAGGTAELLDLKVKIFGKNGELTKIMKNLKDIPETDRPSVGKWVNEARSILDANITAKLTKLEDEELNAKLLREKVDITIQGKAPIIGSQHPLNIVRRKIEDYFISLGFEICSSPEIEFVKYNFDMLNIPKDHPSRDVQDTFYVKDNVVLRTQTSAGQVRLMEKTKPPIKMISPGRVYRPDEVDATHTPCFHQVEGLVVDKDITMSDLKGVLERFAKEFFNQNTKIRFRPSFFPFTEPSVEVDASCSGCGGKGCRICKNTGWIEILGAGMVNRNVLTACDIDPNIYSGFAFGIGLDRITGIIHGITDARVPFEGDVRFLKQFSN